MNIQIYSSLEPSLEYSQDQMPLKNQGYLWPVHPTWKLQKYYAVSD